MLPASYECKSWLQSWYIYNLKIICSDVDLVYHTCTCLNTPVLVYDQYSFTPYGCTEIAKAMHCINKLYTVYSCMWCVGLKFIVAIELTMLLLFTGICHGALQKQRLGFDKDYLAVHVLPFLIPKSTQPTLNVSQVCICNWYCCWVCLYRISCPPVFKPNIGNICSCWLITLFIAVIEALFCRHF